jgi:competence protein ComFB
MTVHNYAEEEVMGKVDEIFDAEEAKPKRSFCTCDFCRADVACFVLNRVSPLYQTSGRGLGHRELDYREKLQREADLATLIYRGIERITATQRPHVYGNAVSEEDQEAQGNYFNFPQILGRLFHSTSFEPLIEVPVRLLSESGEELKMTDTRWSNPCFIPANTPGIFSFWPVSEKAGAPGERKSVEFKIAVDAEAYEPLRHYFSVPLVSEEGRLRYVSGSRVLTLPDLFLVPR